MSEYTTVTPFCQNGLHFRTNWQLLRNTYGTTRRDAARVMPAFLFRRTTSRPRG